MPRPRPASSASPRRWRQENARKGITVNAICPGYIDTDMVAGVPEKVLEAIIAQIPVGRLGKAEEVASLVAYLVSDAAAFMTGAVLSMNGAPVHGERLVRAGSCRRASAASACRSVSVRLRL